MFDRKEYMVERNKNHPWYHAKKMKESRERNKDWLKIKILLKRQELWHPIS